MRKTPQDYINFWPAFTDILTSAFVFFVFIAVILISKNFFDLKELYSLKAIKDDVEKRLQAFQKDFSQEFEIKNNEIKIILDKKNTQISFKSDKADINSIETQSGIDSLEKIGKMIKNFLDKNDTNKLFGVVIEGYTDREESEEYNFNLSYHRAKNIMLFWREKCGLNPNKYDINPVGYGELQSRLRMQTAESWRSDARKIGGSRSGWRRNLGNYSRIKINFGDNYG